MGVLFENIYEFSIFDLLKFTFISIEKLISVLLVGKVVDATFPKDPGSPNLRMVSWNRKNTYASWR